MNQLPIYTKTITITIPFYCWNVVRLCISLPGLISPGVSVPIQVPGGGHPDMGSHMGAMTSQYWPRLQ